MCISLAQKGLMAKSTFDILEKLMTYIPQNYFHSLTCALNNLRNFIHLCPETDLISQFLCMVILQYTRAICLT